jgi:hypothetical protein
LHRAKERAKETGCSRPILASSAFLAVPASTPFTTPLKEHLMSTTQYVFNLKFTDVDGVESSPLIEAHCEGLNAALDLAAYIWNDVLSRANVDEFSSHDLGAMNLTITYDGPSTLSSRGTISRYADGRVIKRTGACVDLD